MKVLITGCNGLVGCRLAKKLADCGITVFGLSKNGLTNPYIHAGNYFQADICDSKTIATLLDDVAPDVLVHAAAITKPDICEQDRELCFSVNFEAAKQILALSQERRIYSIHLSTDFVFAGEPQVHDENSEDFPPVNVYGESKYELEKYILENIPEAAIVRTALVYGYEPLLPRNNILTWAVGELGKGNKIRVVNDQFRSPTFADDLADGIGSLAQSRLAGIFHLAGTEFMSVYEFVCITADVFGLDKHLITPVKTAGLNEPARRPKATCMDITKAASQLNYRPQPTLSNIKTLYQQMNG